MRKFIIRTIVLIIIPIILGALLCEFFLRQIPNDYSYKNGWLSKNISSVEILILGSSHSVYGIKPSCFSAKAFNAAFGSQSLKYDEFILEKFIEKGDSLQFVILPVSYFSLIGNMENSDEWWRIKKYCIYFHCPYHKLEIKYRTEIVGLPIFNQVRRIIKCYIKGLNEITVDKLGWCKNDFSTKKSNEWWYSNGKGRAEYHTYHTKDLNMSLILENEKHIENIIKYCSRQNIRVLLLTTPTYHTYYENLNQKQLEMMQYCCDSFSTVYENTYYLNLLKDQRFIENDFGDSDHLNEFGAEKLSRILNDYCDSLVFQN